MTSLVLIFALVQDPDAIVREARSLVEQGHALEAIEELGAAATRMPESAVIQNELGIVYGVAGRVDEALKAFERAVSLDPDEPSYALSYGELLYRRGRIEEALTELQKASEIPDALILLSAAYEKLGRTDDLFLTLRRYVELKPEDMGARVLLGEKLEGEKRYEDALEVYRQGLGDDAPDDPILLYRIGELQSRNRETYADAEKSARRALEVAPDMLEARLLLARVLARTNRHEEAVRELEAARAKHPDSAEVHYNLAQSYQRLGRTEEAKAAAARFQELSALERESSEREARVAVTYKKAVELLQQGNMIEAEKVFRSVLEIDPDHAQTRSMLAKIAFSKGDTPSALRWIDEAITADPKVGEFHYLKALFHYRSGDTASAEEAVGRSLELDAGFPDAWSLLGSILLDTGRAKGAVGSFLNAAALEPENPAIQLNLASAYAALGQKAEEDAAMERYHRLSER
jgi:protein O-GlcNAc transferase